MPQYCLVLYITMLHKLHKLLRKTHFSLIDWVIVASSLLAILVIGIVLFRKNEFRTITVKVGEDNIYWPAAGPRKLYANLFATGMKEVSGFGKTEAEILKVISYDTDITHKDVYLTVKINATYSRSSNQYIYKGKPVVVGSQIRMYLGSILTDGLITRVDGIADTRAKKIIIVETQLFGDSTVYPQTSGVNPFIPDAVSKGDAIKDDQGNIKVEVLEKRVEDAKQLVTTADGRMIITTNPLKKDMFLTLKIYGFEQNGNLYMFDDIPIFIDVGVPLHLPTIDLFPLVTKILSVQ